MTATHRIAGQLDDSDEEDEDYFKGENSESIIRLEREYSHDHIAEGCICIRKCPLTCGLIFVGLGVLGYIAIIFCTLYFKNVLTTPYSSIYDYDYSDAEFLKEYGDAPFYDDDKVVTSSNDTETNNTIYSPTQRTNPIIPDDNYKNSSNITENVDKKDSRGLNGHKTDEGNTGPKENTSTTLSDPLTTTEPPTKDEDGLKNTGF